MTGDPPFDVGAVQEIVAWALPDVAVTFVGAPGIVARVTVFEELEVAARPARFVAVTANEYDAPFVSPETMHEVVDV